MTAEKRLALDVKRIREDNDRTGPIGNRPLRWEGAELNPNGWRLMRDLADDIQTILEGKNV